MWLPFRNGQTLGAPGSEYGITIRDEEHIGGARITLERDTKSTPFAITCGVYGTMVHTCLFCQEADAVSAYENMKRSLGDIMDCDNEDFSQMIKEFMQKYPYT